MPLVVNPSTGGVLGLRLSLCPDKVLEDIRLGDGGKEGKWFSIFSAIVLSYKNFKIYQFHVKHPDCPARVLAKLVTHGAEELGGYEISDITKAATELLGECRLLVTCAYHVFKGNSVRYEFGFRWYHQTNYTKEFADNFLAVLEVSPVLLTGSRFSEVISKDVAVESEDVFEVTPVIEEARSPLEVDSPLGLEEMPVGLSMGAQEEQEFEDYGISSLQGFLSAAEQVSVIEAKIDENSRSDVVMETELDVALGVLWHGLFREPTSSRELAAMRKLYSEKSLIWLAMSYGWEGEIPLPMPRFMPSSSSTVLATAGLASVSSW